MEQQKYSNLITCLTLTAAAIGFAGCTLSSLIWTGYIVIMLIPKYYPFHPHAWTKIAPISFTTFVFGIINGYSYF